MGAEKKVSVIIPTYNNKESLKLVISAIMQQSIHSSDYEIIVSDDGGSDNTKKTVEAISKDIKYFWQEDLGFRAGQARNLGAKKALGETLIFIDDDTIVPFKFIENHLKMLETSDIVLGYNAGYGDSDYYRIEEIKEKLENQNNIEKLRVIQEFRHHWFLDPNMISSNTNKRLWFVFASGNMSLKKSLFDQCKFDEDFVGWAEEDVELGYRFQKAGKSIVLAANCIAYNIRQPIPGMKSMLTKDKFISTTKNEILLYRKHPVPEVKEYILDRYEHTPEEFRKGTFLDIDNFIFRVDS